MTTRSSRSIVVLGMMTKMPVPGVVWQTLHYLVGLRRLGYDVTYVEAHARTPSMFVEGSRDSGSTEAADFLKHVLSPFGLGDAWALHALHHDGAVLGMDVAALRRTYQAADVILNLCGGTQPRPEHVEGGRLVLVATDPVQIEVELWQRRQETRDFMDAHCAAFTFGENYGKPGCEVPVSADYDLIPTRQPVVLDFWQHGHADSGVYTTVANWHQAFRTLRYRKDVYHWSKDREFLRFLDLPERSGRHLELALASYRPEDRRLLEARGWSVREAADFGFHGDPYRGYVQRSRGEFTVAKDQNVRLRSGWFSDRSATYLAAGRPVVTQDTGFGAALPTGKGLFGVSDLDEAVAALEAIESDYAAARRGALEVARGFFDYRVVLPRMLSDMGVEGPARRFGVPAGPTVGADPGLPDDLVLEPLSRRPLRLAPETVHALLSRPVPEPVPAAPGPPPPDHARTASILVVTHGKLPLTRLCLESLLAHTAHPAYEVIVVDNASPDGTPAYLRELAARHRQVRVVLNAVNAGFAAACNQAARIARGDVLVFLNNDTILPRGWLMELVGPLEDRTIGAVGPSTNRSGTGAEVGGQPDRTYADFVRRAGRAREDSGRLLEPTSMLAFFCLALRRDTWLHVGELDEGYGTGLFEDDDYALRLLEAGLRLACVRRVHVHHFGQASFGDLVADGTYARLHEQNRKRFQDKWNETWKPRDAAAQPDYDALIARVRSSLDGILPPGATVAVVSRGDPRLLDLRGATGWHFPREDDGTWAGHYPAEGKEAVERLERVRGQGAEFLAIPQTGFWWLDHYPELRAHLEERGDPVHRSDDLVVFCLFPRSGERAVESGRDAREARRLAPPPSANGHPSTVATQANGKRSVVRAPAAAPPRPVFIIGSPRSGTSVLTWALGQHPNLYPLEETVWFGRFHAGSLQAFHLGSSRGERSQLSAMGIDRGEFLAALGEAVDGLILGHRSWPDAPVAPQQPYARARSPHDPKRRWVDGTPENSFHVPGLAELFPEAVFIHLLREPDLVVRSLQRFDGIGGRRHTADEAYRKWVAHVRACTTAEGALGPERVRRVLHRDLLASPESVIHACLDFAGESWAPECLLPLSRKINSSGDMPAPEGTERDEARAEVVEEVRALESELFPMAGSRP